MTVEPVLVAGATGTQGGAVADHLLDRGIEVHALTRSPDGDAARALAERGATVVEGDMTDRESLEPLVEAVEGVFLVTTFFEQGVQVEIEQGRTVAAAAADAGVDHLVYSSVEGADRETGLPHFESKYEVEQRIRALDLPATVVRPVSFMGNFERQREEILAGTIAQPLAEGVPLQLVDVDDVGALAAEAFANPEEYAGETIELVGDELTLEEMAEAFSAVTGVDVEPQHVPMETAREGMNEEWVLFYEWINEDGYAADAAAVEREYDLDPTRFETHLRENGWATD